VREIRSLPTWPLVAVALSVAATGALLSQRPDSETAATAPSSTQAPATTTPSTSTSTVTSVRTVTVPARPTTRTTARTTEPQPATRTTAETTTTAVPPSATTTAPPPPPASTSRPRLCDPAYPTLCLSIAAPRLDCADIPDRDFPVRRPDRHRFDPDRDGIGCESA